MFDGTPREVFSHYRELEADRSGGAAGDLRDAPA